MSAPEQAQDPCPHPAWARAEIVDAQAGQVLVTPRRAKVAIVGFAESSRDQAPFDDPTYEIWGLNSLARMLPRYDRWFEMHTRAAFEADPPPFFDYLGWLRTAPVPVYMIERQPDMPSSVRYPLEAIVKTFGIDYFTSSPSFMVALAMFEGFEEIAVYGIDLIVGREWAYEKPCMEYWLGRAHAMGVLVRIPESSALLRSTHRYGYTTEPTYGPFRLSAFDEQIAGLRKEHNEALTVVNAAEGATLELDGLLQEPALSREILLARRAAIQETWNKALSKVNAIEGAMQIAEFWRSALDLTLKGGTFTWRSP